MERNMGTTDRALRIVVLGPLAIWGALATSGVVALLLGVVAGIMFLTGLVGFCPLYALFGIDTRPHQVSPGA